MEKDNFSVKIKKNFLNSVFRKRMTSLRGTSFSATICDTLYLLDMEGEIKELVTKDFQVGNLTNSELNLSLNSLSQYCPYLNYQSNIVFVSRAGVGLNTDG